MADGAVYAKVTLDDKDAVKALNRLREKIAQLQDELNTKRAERDSIAQRMAEAEAATERARLRVKELQDALALDPRNASLKESLKIASSDLKEQEREMDALNKQWQKLNTEIPKGEANLAKMESQAAELARQIAASNSVMGRLGKASDAAHKKMKHMSEGFSRLIKRIVVYSLFRQLFRSIQEYFIDYAKVIPEVSDAVSRLRGAFLSLVYPIVNAVTPALVSMLNIITKIVSTLAQAFAYLFGMTAQQAEDGAEALEREKDALNGAGKAAKKAAKQFANFDEINQLTDTSGGGGGGGKANAFEPIFDIGEQLPDDYLEYVLKMVELIGAAILAWKINPIFGQGILKTFGGILLIVDGVTRGIKAVKDVLENGWSTENLTEVLKAILEIGAGIGLLTGSWIPLLVAGIAAVLLAITVLTGHGQELIDGLKQTFQGFVDFVKGVFSGDINLALKGVGEIFQGLSKTINSIVFSIRDLLLKGLDWLDRVTHGRFHDAIEWAKEWVRTRFAIISQFVTGFFSAWEQIFRGFVQIIHGIFTNDWAEVWKGAKNVVFGAVNLIITAIEYVINRVIQGVNALIDVINSIIASDMAQKAAGFFGFEWSGISHLSLVTLPRIPMLAQGAVIPPNREFLAMLGDQKSGTNIEAPLDTIVAAFRQVMGERGNNQTIILECNKRQFAQLVLDMNNLNSQRIGAKLGGAT